MSEGITKLGDFKPMNIKMTDEQGKKKTMQYKTATPVYTRKLVEECGLNHRQLGDKIGVSGSTIGQGLRENSISEVVECAAQGLYEREYIAKIPEHLYVLVKIRPAQWEMLDHAVKNLGGSLGTI